MKHGDQHQAYLELAEALDTGSRTERDLRTVVVSLPALKEPLLIELGNLAERASVISPRRSWAITTVTFWAAKIQKQDLFIRSLAAWQLGRAFNHWGRPQQSKRIITQARRGFEKLNHPGWIAACDWQRYALPWTSTNIPQAVKVLAQALAALEMDGFEQLASHCRLALAYAQQLVDDFDHAKGNIRASEQFFNTSGDQLNRARCWLNEASCLRRENRIPEAMDKLHETLPIFEAENAPLDTAKTYYYMALCHLLKADDLLRAEDFFKKAMTIFQAHDMDLWHALCTNNLAYVYLLSGFLEKSNVQFEQARKVFIHHNVLGMLADNLNDNGKLNNRRGNPLASIKQFQQAEEIHERLSLLSAAAIDAANLGEAYGLIGRYQDALQCLERALDRFKLVNNYLRLESSEKFVALIWAQLGQPERALEHLDSASYYLGQSTAAVSFSSIYNYRASILFEQKRDAEAMEFLRMSLDAAMSHGLRPQAALARRLLGEALARNGEPSQAMQFLTYAYSDFTEMGMVMEQASTLVAIGNAHVLRFEFDEAKEAFESGLKLSNGIMPEIEWRAHAGLADLAEAGGDLESEFDAYRQAITALTKVRENFWQPVLAGSYLHSPSRVFDKAIRHAASHGFSQDALKFIEQGKATTLLTQFDLARASAKTKETQEIIVLKSEISWLQDKLRVSFDSSHPFKMVAHSREVRTKLIEKIKLYNDLMAHAERKSNINSVAAALPVSFSLDVFRSLANKVIGESWVALDYYMIEESLIIIVITPDNCSAYCSPISHRFRIALETCSKNKQSPTPSQNDLGVLGDFLIPAPVAESLKPDTYLMLAPHGRLHGIPWAAIQPGSKSQPLVTTCIPSVIPSLRSLSVLWKRSTLESAQRRENGLVIGVSSFQGRKRELSHVKDEVAALRLRLGPSGVLLEDANATWKNIGKLEMRSRIPRRGINESRFGWLHISTHFNADPHTGRLSGVTLWDGDVWLDQLRDLAPLPNLVSISACNSIFSFVYEGDEHVGLPATCFVAGANNVVGSIWPIGDEAAAKFTISFYKNYLAGLSGATAVSQTQRWLIQQGERMNDWASFVCMGAP